MVAYSRLLASPFRKVGGTFLAMKCGTKRGGFFKREVVEWEYGNLSRCVFGFDVYLWGGAREFCVLSGVED